jgi:hypothetical protein
MVLYGPSQISEATFKPNKSTRAHQWKVRCVTPGMVAGAAILVSYSLFDVVRFLNEYRLVG